MPRSIAYTRYSRMHELERVLGYITATLTSGLVEGEDNSHEEEQTRDDEEYVQADFAQGERIGLIASVAGMALLDLRGASTKWHSGGDSGDLHPLLCHMQLQPTGQCGPACVFCGQGRRRRRQVLVFQSCGRWSRHRCVRGSM